MNCRCTFQPGSLTVNSASLCHHLLGVYQHKARTVVTHKTYISLPSLLANLPFLPPLLRTKETSETGDRGAFEPVGGRFIIMNCCAFLPFWSTSRRLGARYPLAIHSKPACTINPSIHGCDCVILLFVGRSKSQHACAPPPTCTTTINTSHPPLPGDLNIMPRRIKHSVGQTAITWSQLEAATALAPSDSSNAFDSPSPRTYLFHTPTCAGGSEKSPKLRRTSSNEESPLGSLDAPPNIVEGGERGEEIDASPTGNSRGGRGESWREVREGEGMGLPLGGRQSDGFMSVGDII